MYIQKNRNFVYTNYQVKCIYKLAIKSKIEVVQGESPCLYIEN